MEILDKKERNWSWKNKKCFTKFSKKQFAWLYAQNL